MRRCVAFVRRPVRDDFDASAERRSEFLVNVGRIKGSIHGESGRSRENLEPIRDAGSITNQGSKRKGTMPPPVDAAKDNAVRSVLIVDDDVDVLRFLRDTLVAFADCQVDTSPSPEYAFELSIRKSYNLFLFDFSMPIMDGAVLYNMIRKVHEFGALTPPRPLPPLILMSGHGEKQRARELLAEPGVRGLLPKPFSIERLLSKLESCLPGVTRRPV